MGIPILQGRDFAPSDRFDSPPVAIVDASFARRHFPGADPIGRRVRASNDRTFREIVGVVGAVRQTRLEDAGEPHLYVAQSQFPSATMTFVIRTAGEPSALGASVRERLRAIDPRQPVFNIRPLTAVVDGSVAPRRVNVLLLALFALLAIMLMLVGIYGLIAYSVAESTREIGVRMALGAGRRSILSLVLGRTLRVTGAGAGAGLAIAFASTRAMQALLYGVRPADPLTFALATAAVVAAALVASYLPARRALRVDPASRCYRCVVAPRVAASAAGPVIVAATT